MGLTLSIAVAILLILLVIEAPVSVSLAVSGTVGLILSQGLGTADSVLASTPYNITASYSLAVIPMYILMGAVATRAGIASDLFDVANKYLGKRKGGLAVAAIAGCAGFAAITGSSVATVASIGRTAILEMRRHGYPDSLSTGAVAAAGTLGILIPPSIVLVIYGVLTNISVASLLAAGLIPGILTAVTYSITAVILARRHDRKELKQAGKSNLLLQQSSKESVSTEITGSIEGAESLSNPLATKTSQKAGSQFSDAPGEVTITQYMGVVKMAVLFSIVIGGVYMGFFTATEASAIGALVAVVMLLVSRRKLKDGKRIKALFKAFEDSASLTSSVFAVMIGAGIFSFFLVSIGAPAQFTKWATSLPLTPTALIVVFLLIVIPLGMVFDSISILLISVPLLYPTVDALGFNGIWFGILVVKLIEIGLVTPPVGLNVYVISGGVPGVKAETVFKGVLPFIGADTILIIILFMNPEIILWLPNLISQ